MGNTTCCNSQSQLNNIGEQKIVTDLDSNFLQRKSSSRSISNAISKIQMQNQKNNSELVEFPQISDKIQALLKAIKNDGIISAGKKQNIGFKHNDKMAVFEGQIKSGEADGFGRISFFDQSYFQGLFQNGKPLKGIYIISNAQGYYQGQIQDFQATGSGIYRNLLTGYSYQGQWSKNLQHGFGKQKFANGDQFIGKFMYGGKFDKGKYIFANGNVYEGYFYNGYSDGFGKLEMKNGDTYEGYWKLGKMHGKGLYKWKNGQRYDGQYEDGLREGYGTYYFEDGYSYEGEWTKGQQNGDGKITQGFDQIKGKWSMGQKIDQQ